MLSLINKGLDLLLSVIPKSKNTSVNVQNSPQTSAQANNESTPQPSQEKRVAITLDAYFADPQTGKDRRILFPNEYNEELLKNAKDLLERVNALLSDLGIVDVIVSSGWRPSSANAAAGGAKKSLHMSCKAVDIKDTNGKIDTVLESDKGQKLLEKYGLWQEHPSKTLSWTHIDCGIRPIKVRPNCKPRQFNP